MSPPLRPPTATALGGIGNNLAVACPCGRIIAAPAMYVSKCHCGRRFRAVGVADDERFVDVWESGDVENDVATYRVSAVAPLQPKGNAV